MSHTPPPSRSQRTFPHQSAPTLGGDMDTPPRSKDTRLKAFTTPLDISCLIFPRLTIKESERDGDAIFQKLHHPNSTFLFLCLRLKRPELYPSPSQQRHRQQALDAADAHYRPYVFGLTERVTFKRLSKEYRCEERVESFDGFLTFESSLMS